MNEDKKEKLPSMRVSADDFIRVQETLPAFRHDQGSLVKALGVSIDEINEKKLKIRSEAMVEKPDSISQFLEKFEKHFTKRELLFLLNQEIMKGGFPF